MRPDQFALIALAVWSALFLVFKSRDSSRWVRSCLFALSLPLAFVSAPVFGQYLLLPVIGALVVIIGAMEHRVTRWGIVMVALIHVICDQQEILRMPKRHSPIAEMKDVCAEISKRIDPHGLMAATLSPLYAIECGSEVYPEFATGPFLYRIAERINPDEPTRQLTTSSAALTEFLDARNPDLIITGQEGSYDKGFDAYAHERVYEQIVSRPRIRVYLRVVERP
jgi:hypothetical protein